MEEKEFNIKTRKETFKIAKISPVELLSISTQINFNNLQQTETVFNFALEHTLVKIEDSWLPVKEKSKEVYWPATMETDFLSLNELITYFLNNVIKKVFTKSEELNKTTK